jgi:hypothetical protein
MSDEFYNADKEYSKTVANEVIMLGYHSWGRPLVQGMQKDIKLTASVVPIAVEWSRHAAYMTGISNKDSEIGKAILNKAIPECEKLGQILIERNLLDYQFDEKLVVQLVKKYMRNDLKEIDVDSFFKELKENLPK